MSNDLKESDAELFRESVADAQPMQTDRTEPFRRRRRPIPIEQPAQRRDWDGPLELSESQIETPPFLLFARPGIQKRLLSDLQRGRIQVELELDLHGLTVAYAQQVLDEFLQDCVDRRVRCALIVHGKGSRSAGRQPVLKCKVNYWLRLYQRVLAFCSATRRDGGTGATYVLLRNPRKSQRQPAAD